MRARSTPALPRRGEAVLRAGGHPRERGLRGQCRRCFAMVNIRRRLVTRRAHWDGAVGNVRVDPWSQASALAGAWPMRLSDISATIRARHDKGTWGAWPTRPSPCARWVFRGNASRRKCLSAPVSSAKLNIFRNSCVNSTTWLSHEMHENSPERQRAISGEQAGDKHLLAGPGAPIPSISSPSRRDGQARSLRAVSQSLAICALSSSRPSNFASGRM